MEQNQALGRTPIQGKITGTEHASPDPFPCPSRVLPVLEDTAIGCRKMTCALCRMLVSIAAGAALPAAGMLQAEPVPASPERPTGLTSRVAPPRLAPNRFTSEGSVGTRVRFEPCLQIPDLSTPRDRALWEAPDKMLRWIGSLPICTSRTHPVSHRSLR